MLTNHTYEIPESSEIEDRLAAYAVTDRRYEARLSARLPVCASIPGESDTVEGVAVNVSWSGLQLLMPSPPEQAHHDVLISDDHGTSVVWGHVLEFRFVPEEDAFSWHVHVIAVDDDWMPLLRRLVLPPE